MKVLILSLVFPPDNVSTAHVVGGHASGFRRHGHEVVVLTSTPHYHADAIEAWQKGVVPVFGPLIVKSTTGGVTAYHVKMPDKANPVFIRLVSWVWYQIASTLLGLKVSRGCDVILATPPPPLTVALAAWLLGAMRGIPFVYNVQEVYPDVAVTLGALRRPSVIAFFRRLERLVYARAAALAVISRGMEESLLGKGVPRSKVVRIPNFVDPDELPLRPRDNAFARTHGLVGRFVVSYAGNMGVPQGLGSVLDAARLLKDTPDVVFLMVGDGAALPALRAQAERDQLGNVLFLPYQPYASVPDIYASSDICLVPQAEGTGHQGLPSKIYRILACGRPVVGICEPDSEVVTLIAEAGSGVTVPPNDGPALADAVAAAFADRTSWANRGARGRVFVQEHYSAARIVGQYLELFGALTPGRSA
jgi:colanic acid biosynthesis glycosyl transferase WcaI